MEKLEKVERKQVPEDDPIYQAERERKQNAFRWESVFGRGVTQYKSQQEKYTYLQERIQTLQEALQTANEELVVHLKDELEKTIKSRDEAHEKLGEELQDDFKYFTKNLWHNLLHIVRRRDRADFVLGELQYMFDMKELQVPAHIDMSNTLPEFVDFLDIELEKNRISREVLYQAGKKHVEHVQKRKEKLQEIGDEIREAFREDVMKGVEEGWLPAEAAESLKRIDSVKFAIMDCLFAPHSDIIGMHGDSGVIVASTDLVDAADDGKLKHMIYHELLHEISGTSITIETEERKILGTTRDVHSVRRKKVGIQIGSSSTDKGSYTWLNEGITEWLALRLSGYSGEGTRYTYKGSSAYTHERQEIDHLLDSGLEEEVLTDAYFENITQNIPMEERGRYFSSLVRRINELEKREHYFTYLENKHTLNHLSYNLTYEHINSLDKNQIDTIKLKPGDRLFVIHVVVGEHPKSTVEGDFMHIVTTSGRAAVSKDEVEENIQKIFESQKSTFRHKITYTVTEEDVSLHN